MRGVGGRRDLRVERGDAKEVTGDEGGRPFFFLMGRGRRLFEQRKAGRGIWRVEGGTEGVFLVRSPNLVCIFGYLKPWKALYLYQP